MLTAAEVMQLIGSLFCGLGLIFVGLERVADHLVNVGYSIVNPIGSEKD